MIEPNSEILYRWEILELDNIEESYKNYERVFGTKGIIHVRDGKWGVIQDIPESDEDSQLPVKKLPRAKLMTVVRGTNAVSLI